MKNVYFKAIGSYSETEEIQCGAKSLLKKVIDEEHVQLEPYIPLKVHFGEKGNITFIESKNFEGIIEYLQEKHRGCDCEGHKMKPIAGDIGVFASTDPVAIDQACLDMIDRREGKKFFTRARSQLEYAEKIGLGKRQSIRWRGISHQRNRNRFFVVFPFQERGRVVALGDSGGVFSQ